MRSEELRQIVKILVSAASKYGSTTEIARRIGDVLTARGHDVGVQTPNGVDVAGYDAVVLARNIKPGRGIGYLAVPDRRKARKQCPDPR